VRLLANQPLLSRSFQRMDVDLLHSTVAGKPLRATIARAARLARTRTSDRALPRFTTQHSGHRRIVDKPPLITRVPRATYQRIAAAIDDYLTTLAPLAPRRRRLRWSTSRQSRRCRQRRPENYVALLEEPPDDKSSCS
jgi:hypothetical protein